MFASSFMRASLVNQTNAQSRKLKVHCLESYLVTDSQKEDFIASPQFKELFEVHQLQVKTCNAVV